MMIQSPRFSAICMVSSREPLPQAVAAGFDTLKAVVEKQFPRQQNDPVGVMLSPHTPPSKPLWRRLPFRPQAMTSATPQYNLKVWYSDGQHLGNSQEFVPFSADYLTRAEELSKLTQRVLQVIEQVKNTGDKAAQLSIPPYPGLPKEPRPADFMA